MSKYITHLEGMYSPNTFRWKMDYIKYNFSELFDEKDVKNFSILEIGPGMGECIKYSNNIGIKNVDVVDNDKEILEYSKKNYKIRKAILSEDLPSIDNKLNMYNLIFLIQVLEHMPVNSYGKTLRTLYKLLKKGGSLILVVPNANNPLGLSERYGDLQHTNSFTERSLMDLIGNAKIKNYEFKITGFEIPPYSTINIIRIVLQKMLHLVLYAVMIINGGVHFRVMTPNIVLNLRKIS